MKWSCAACTFVNGSENASRCEMCGTSRNGGKSKPSNKAVSSLSRSSGRQTTLFGAFAASNPKSKTSKPVKNQSRTMTAANGFFSQNNRSTSLNTLEAPFSTLKARSEKVLQETFRIGKLRFLQPDAVDCALKRQSQLLVMSTGGGKSLCYQLPAVTLGGTTLVVSPLKALISDQVAALKKKGIRAEALLGNLSEGKKTDLFERLLQRSLRTAKKSSKKPSVDHSSLPPLTLLYCTPEQISQSERLQSALSELHKKKRLTGFAIDEAHCLSEWGHDFRPAFRKLGWLREQFPDCPLMACTATATKAVVDDIIKTLRLEGQPCHLGSFDRSNISYECRYKDGLEISNPNGGAMKDMLDFIKSQHVQKNKNPIAGIVYVHKREDAVELAERITTDSGVKAVAYHGGMKDQERQELQEDWMTGRAQVAVATVAFGMGVDLAHVRYVVHWTISKSVENFYQESGRAGRDGLPSISLVYYSRSDERLFRFLASKGKQSEKKESALDKMSDYCLKEGCRRKYLLQFFGERKPVACNKKCDFCKDPESVTRAMEAAQTFTDFTFHTSSSAYGANEWDGQLNAPHGDDVVYADDGDPEMESDGLLVKGPSVYIDVQEEDSNSRGKKRRSYDEVLKKYDKLEMMDNNQASGFVNFRAREDDEGEINLEDRARPQKILGLPDHLRANAPDPLAHFQKQKEDVASSKEIADDAARRRRELAEKQAQLKTLLAQAKSRSASRSAPVAPPPAPMMRPSKRRRN